MSAQQQLTGNLFSQNFPQSLNKFNNDQLNKDHLVNHGQSANIKRKTATTFQSNNPTTRIDSNMTVVTNPLNNNNLNHLSSTNSQQLNYLNFQQSSSISQTLMLSPTQQQQQQLNINGQYSAKPVVKFNQALNAYSLKKNRHLFLLLNSSQNDCLFCQTTQQSYVQHPIITQQLSKKYMTSREYYDAKIVNDIIYNEPTRLVSVFKDYLIYDDVSEFLKRSYTTQEAKVRLPKIFEFYEKYSKVFPNYVVIPENQYMFKNIERKQRLIDEKQKIIMDQQQKLKDKKKVQQTKNGVAKGYQNNIQVDSSFKKNQLFTSKFIESVINNHNPSNMDDIHPSDLHNSRSLIVEYKTLTRNKAFQNKPQNHLKNLGDIQFDKLIEKFLSKDSEIMNTMMNDTMLSINYSNFQNDIQTQQNIQQQKKKLEREKKESGTATDISDFQLEEVITKNINSQGMTQLQDKYKKLQQQNNQQFSNLNPNIALKSDNAPKHQPIKEAFEYVQHRPNQIAADSGNYQNNQMGQGMLSSRSSQQQRQNSSKSQQKRRTISNSSNRQLQVENSGVPVYSNIASINPSTVKNQERLFSPILITQSSQNYQSISSTQQNNEVTTPRSFLKQKAQQDKKIVSSLTGGGGALSQRTLINPTPEILSNFQLQTFNTNQTSRAAHGSQNGANRRLSENIFNLKQAQSAREQSNKPHQRSNSQKQNGSQNTANNKNSNNLLKRSSSTTSQQINGQNVNTLLNQNPYAQQQPASFLKQSQTIRQKNLPQVQNEQIYETYQLTHSSSQQQLSGRPSQPQLYSNTFKQSSVYDNLGSIGSLLQPYNSQSIINNNGSASSGNYTSRVAAQSMNSNIKSGLQQQMQQFNYQQFYPQHTDDGNSGIRKSSERQQYYTHRYSNGGIQELKQQNTVSANSKINQMFSPISQKNQVSNKNQQSQKGIPITVQKNIIIKKQKQ
eukprot:403344672